MGIYNASISTGTISLKGAEISGTSGSGAAHGINNQGATSIAITGTNTYKTKLTGKTTSGTGRGIYNSTGTLKLWNTEGTADSINVNYPRIVGSTYGVQITGSEFEWYDGRIIGKTPLNTSITITFPTGCADTEGTDDNEPSLTASWIEEVPTTLYLMNSSDSTTADTDNDYPSTGFTWKWNTTSGFVNSSSSAFWASDGRIGCTYYITSDATTYGYTYGYTKIGKGRLLKNYTKINATAYCKAFVSSDVEYILWGIGTSGTATPGLVNSGKMASLSTSGTSMSKTSLTIPTASIVDNQDYYFVFVVSKRYPNGYTHFLPRKVYLSQ